MSWTPMVFRGVLIVSLAAWCGCPVSQSQDFPAPIRQEHTLGTQRDYFLYVPSTYAPDRQWPLVVTCHGTWPYDGARPQAKEWAALAEGRGFIVAAPKLKGVRGDAWFRTPGRQIELQLEDEAVILEIVSRVKAAYNVADEQVFLTGWSAGGYAVLFTGLRNPDVFRALAIRQGNFDERYLSPVMPRLDRYQPILVLFGATDVLLKSQGERCIQWLRSQRMNVHRREIAGGHRRRPDIAYGFFRRQAREPWVLVDAVGGYNGQPLAIRGRARCRPEATACYWWFGDGGTGRGANVVHAYEQPGTYTVTMQAVMPGGGKVLRKIEVAVPTVQVGVEPKPST